MKAKLLQHHRAYREAEDYDNPLRLPSQVAEHLHQWSFNGFRMLTREDIAYLIKKAPFEGGKLYRGMNFKTQESYEDFWAKTKGGTMFPGRAWSSWTPHENEAWAFAITWPTYNLNYELMHAEDAKSKNRDYMIGYQGVIVSLEVGPGVAADIRETGFAHESEIIVPEGTYPMEVVKNLKPFKRDITNQSEADAQFMSITNLSGGSDNFDRQKFTFIVHHFPSFSPEARQHLMDILTIPKQVMVKVETREHGFSFDEPKMDLYIRDNISYDMVAYFSLLPPAGQSRVKKFVDSVMREKIRQVSAFLKEHDLDWSKVRVQDDTKMVESVVNPALASKYKELFRSGLSQRYQKMDESIRDINKEKDPNKQRSMIEQYKNQMVDLISNMQKLGNSRKGSIKSL